MSIVNVFMLSIEKKAAFHLHHYMSLVWIKDHYVKLYQMLGKYLKINISTGKKNS